MSNDSETLDDGLGVTPLRRASTFFLTRPRRFSNLDVSIEVALRRADLPKENNNHIETIGSLKSSESLVIKGNLKICYLYKRKNQKYSLGILIFSKELV